MKQKTTLYLEEEDIKELKRIALENKGQTMTSLIQSAIRQYISKQYNTPKKFRGLRKIKGSLKENYFGDAVELQRQLRKEWDR